MFGFAAPAARTAEPVRIGIMWPLTGNAAAAGQASKAAVEVALDIINNAHPELANLPLAATTGLPNLGGAKIEVTLVDHQGDPSMAQQLTTRLVTQDKVNALMGAYQSSCSFTATAVAERYGVPFMVGESAALNITGRGFKWVFRGTPIASDYARTYMRFFADLKKQGRKIDSIAVVNENTDYGTSVGDAIEAEAKQTGVPVAIRIPYSASSTDVSAQVLQLKQKQPDVVIFISYTADSILYMKTMRNLDYRPPMVIGDDTGFSDPSFIPAVSDVAQGAMNRSAWDIGKPGSTTYKINEMYKAKTGRDLDDTSARNMQSLFALADAINRAGSTDPEKIRDALAKTDLKPDQLMMGYQGVKFDETGQNILAATYLIQLQGKQYQLVWPETAANAKLQWPMAGWTQ
ncbi:branched-chain amino acid ABC transporter substrate-binding protein [Bradyrhizobium centrolobii]|uniref:Branched-chain amino acid ABC transporter substrate-binding protein n=2 Tax=Bradyrhizobium centrolobii TaxID=1505087 RepID=A0A176Y5D3_9BRAD|nr:branched-chain amino acid ABC transporter substrate-binding protein [Bradyrhizobium centrolobii]